MVRPFSSFVFFSVVLSKSMCISTFELCSIPSNFFLYCLSIQFFLYVFWLICFSPKSFGFSCIRLLACFYVISSQLLVEFSFVVLECHACMYCFTLCRYFFNLSSFTRTFWFLSLSCIVIITCDAFSFFSLRVPATFLCFFHFSLFRSFFLHFQSNCPSWFLIFPSCF